MTVPYPKTKTQFVIGEAIMVLLFAVGLFLVFHHPAVHTTPASKPKVITYSTDKPDEIPPPTDYSWAGGSDDPKLISLPTIDTQGFIQQVGVDQNKQVAVPTNVHMAGWFVDTVRPGQAGLAVIDGHVDGLTTGGIFRNLKKLKVGDQFSVTLGSGYTIYYAVTSVAAIDAGDAVSPLFSQDPSVASQLNLITCGGTFNTTTKTYDHRIIVTAKVLTPADHS